MKIVIMGAGGVGGIIGAHLQQGGHEIVYVARGPHLWAMKTRGLAIRTEKAEVKLPVTATDNPASAGHADLVVLSVKTPDNPPAIDAIKPLVDPSYPVMSVQNGVRTPNELAVVFGPNQVLAATVAIGCWIVEPGVIAGPLPETPVKMAVGEMGGHISERSLRIQSEFAKANIQVELWEDVLSMLWRKLLLVGPRSVLQTLARCDFLPLFRDVAVELRVLTDLLDPLKLLEELLREYMAVGRAEGADLPDNLIEELLRPVREGRPTTASTYFAGQKPSLLRDAEARRQLEVEAMIGFVVRRAAKLGISVPRAETLYSVLYLMDAANRARLQEKK